MLNICAICREVMESDGGDVHTTPCGHDFHIHCIDRWNRVRPTCPLCRAVITQTRSSAMLLLCSFFLFLCHLLMYTVSVESHCDSTPCDIVKVVTHINFCLSAVWLIYVIKTTY